MLNPLFYLSVFAFLTSLFLSVFVWLKDTKNQVNITYALLNFCLAAWILWDIISVVLTPKDLGLALALSRAVYALAVFVPIFYLHFVYALIGLKRKYWLIIGYLISLVFFVSIPTNLFINKIDAGTAFGFSRLLTGGGFLFDIFGLFYFATAIIGLVELIRAFFGTQGHKRQQVGYFIMATLIAYSAGPLYFLSLYGISLPPLDNLLLSFYVMLMAYAIVKQRFLDMPVIISKTSARLITYGFYAGVYIAIVLFYFSFISAQPDYLFLLFTVAFGILGVETANPTRLAIQTTTDKLFLRGKYDYYFELEHIGADLANSAGFDELLTYLNDAFINNLEVGRPRLFIPKDDKTGDFYAWDLIGKKAIPETIKKGSFIFEYFSEVNTVAEKGEHRSEKLDRAFAEIGAELLIPCYFRGQLLGILALGQKLSQEDFTDEDIQLLKTVSHQIGAAIERARAYEDLKAEVEKARAQMEISSRLSSLGTLAAGVTHEIRNPLAVIQSKLELLPDRLDDKEFLKNLSEVLPRHIERIVGLINRLLFFAKPEKHLTQKINICQVLQDTIDLMDGEANRRDIKIVKDLKDLEVMGDFSQLSQVFLNIMLNGIQSMGAGGVLRVSTLSSNSWVITTISDTGPGIAPENLGRIFDPFFTTRAAGTGLGLAISRRIIEEHKGEISVVSELGKGAVFTIKLPAY